MTEMMIKRRNWVREIETKMSDARICVIKMLERIESVGSQRWKRRTRARESKAENNEWLRERMRKYFG